MKRHGVNILADLIELPNLAQRAVRHWGYRFEHQVLWLRDATSPAVTSPERAGFAGYGVLPPLYRIVVTWAIALFIGTQFFFGVLPAIWAVAMVIGLPRLRAIKHLQSRPSLRARRPRALAGAALLAAVPGSVARVGQPLIHRADAALVAQLRTLQACGVEREAT